MRGVDLERFRAGALGHDAFLVRVDRLVAVATTAHDGSVFHAAVEALSSNAETAIGRCEKPPRLLRRKADKKAVGAALVLKGAAVLRAEEVEAVPGPGLMHKR